MVINSHMFPPGMSSGYGYDYYGNNYIERWKLKTKMGFHIHIISVTFSHIMKGFMYDLRGNLLYDRLIYRKISQKRVRLCENFSINWLSMIISRVISG